MEEPSGAVLVDFRVSKRTEQKAGAVGGRGAVVLKAG